MLLKDKTAVVTGCSRGIGRAILEAYARNGADIYAHARAESAEFTGLITTLAQANGVMITPVYFDLANEEAVKEAAKSIIATKKKIDVLVNNAGVTSGGFFQMTSMQEFKRVFEINFFAQILFTQMLSRYMARSKAGSIINIGSTAGLNGAAGTVGYGASKAALMYASKAMAAELGDSNIRVNAIAPSLTRTDMFDAMEAKGRSKLIESSALKRPAEAEEIANVAVFLASDLSTYVTGQVLRVDGGYA